MAEYTISICSGCGPQGLYEHLAAEANCVPAISVVTQPCLGSCGYTGRVDVFGPDGVIKYANTAAGTTLNPTHLKLPNPLNLDALLEPHLVAKK